MFDTINARVNRKFSLSIKIFVIVCNIRCRDFTKIAPCRRSRLHIFTSQIPKMKFFGTITAFYLRSMIKAKALEIQCFEDVVPPTARGG